MQKALSLPDDTAAEYLAVQNIVRRFGSNLALNDVSFSASEGEIICLVGQSGCGKSSLLRIISGVDKADSGTVAVDGAEVAGASCYVEPEDRKIGFIFQDYALFPHLSVSENILFGLRKLTKSEARLRCSETIARLGIEHLAERFPHMLSGGEQQRVALARALAPQPRILLMDEPFSNLDRRLRQDIRDETISFLRAIGTTVVMVTHDPEEALSAGDRVILMRSGEIVQTGSAEAVYDHPANAYAAEFFSPFNKVDGISRNGTVQTPLGAFASPGIAEGGKACVYIRPQSIRLAADGIAGSVLERVFLGEIEQTSVAVEGIAEPLRIRSTVRNRTTPGSRVHLQIDAEGVFVFRTT